MHAVERIVAQALARIGVGRDELILVALSGGPDSVALLRALVELKAALRLRLCAAHFNHRLRGEESERDEAFVRSLCDQLALPLFVEAAKGLSPCAPNLEERARILRFDFLNRVAASCGATRIALGHNRDDQAETFLMRLLRGAGASGLSGMAEAGPGNLIRPLLAASRQQILSYLAVLGAAWVVDSSNRQAARTRNRVRHELMPLLETHYAPGLSRRLTALSLELAHLDQLVVGLARRELASRELNAEELKIGALGALRIDGLGRLPAALVSALVREFIAQRAGSLRRVGRAHIDAVVRLCLSGPPNGRVSLPGRLSLRREYDRVLIERASPAHASLIAFDLAIAVPGRTPVKPASISFDAELARAEGAPCAPTLNEAWFDADQIAGGLRVRNFRPGDRITLTPGSLSRKVKKLFQERRVPREQRATFPVVTLGGEIAWLPGVARAPHALVSTGTAMVLKLRAHSLIARR
jgi:tRNA(Ile)-lysidine synthase